MSYSYSTERSKIFTEEGQVMFLNIRDKTNSLLDSAGACRCQEMIDRCTGDSWTMLACVDRLVELKEIQEITPNTVHGQDRVFIRHVGW
jgi:hypothetical protein